MPLQFRFAGGEIKNNQIVLCLPYQQQHHSTGYPLKSELHFEVDVSVQLVGLQHLSGGSTNFDSFSITLRKLDSLENLAGGNSADKSMSNDSGEILRLSPRCNLYPHTISIAY